MTDGSRKAIIAALFANLGTPMARLIYLGPDVHRDQTPDE